VQFEAHIMQAHLAWRKGLPVNDAVNDLH